MSLAVALRAFWASLTDASTAQRVAMALDPTVSEPGNLLESTEVTSSTPPIQPKEQNAAITLLATLQREARLVDLIEEDLDQYGDAQVGAAARPCLKQSRQTLDRVLGLQKLVDAPENDTIQLPQPINTSRYRWVGEDGGGDESAKLVHGGWVATKTDLPIWSGQPDDASIIAAAQVQAGP